MGLILVIILTLGFLVLTWWYMKMLKLNKYLGKYPGPRPLPILGSVHHFKSTADIIPVMMDFQKTFGGLYKMMVGPHARLIITDPVAAEYLLGSNTILEKSYEYKYYHSWLGTGLLTSSGAKWKRQRKLITPTFHFQILEKFIETFNTQSSVLVEKLRKEVEGKYFDVFPYISLCALDIICEAAMGTPVNAQNNSESEYVHSVKEMCRIGIDRALSPFKMWDLLYPLSKDYAKEKRALEETRKNDDEEVGIKKRLAFLDLLLQCSVEGKPLSNESIREEVDTFMFAGHDTTTSGISFTLYCLSQNTEVQEKVVEELRNIFVDDKTRSPNYQDLQDMKYLEMVIKESLRLYPPVPFYARILQEDVAFKDEILPKGVALGIFSYGLHRNPKIFSDPEKFDPERFSSENVIGRSPFAYLPFSAGPRNCIGQRFAMLEMKSTVSRILRNFEILPLPQHKPILIAETILKSGNGLPVCLKERQI